MAQPLYWPGKYFFYAIGNTPAQCLTRDIAFDDNASVLLLGCGDPRNILYTLFCEPEAGNRRLDFTCCDVDPGVLARNVLLLSMIADRKPSDIANWNVFFHLYLDAQSYEVLIEQCKKLVEFSGSISQWLESPYGRFLRMSTAYTLAELRRHWVLYIDMHDLPPARLQDIQDAFKAFIRTLPSTGEGLNLNSARSLGPLAVVPEAIEALSKQFVHYRRHGVTFSGSDRIANASILNPTFVYSLMGEECALHYDIDPFRCFHSAALYGNAGGSVSTMDIVNTAKLEFSDWCTSFHTSINFSSTAPVVRVFLGEATAVARALQLYALNQHVATKVPVAQWKTELIQLSEEEYIAAGAPTSYNIIDTSNLSDHVGLLNVLTMTAPLLKEAALSSVLYTESLLFSGQNAPKEFADRLYTDIGTLGNLIGLSPVDYLTGFNSRCNTTELLLYETCKQNMSQFHQMTTWKSPVHSDPNTIQDNLTWRPPVFDPYQLGTFLYGMYHNIFEQEDCSRWFQANKANLMTALTHSNIILYMRESFVLFLKLVRDRLKISEERWKAVIDRFFDLQDADKSMPMDSMNYQEFCVQLCYQRVHSLLIYQIPLPRIGRFARWDVITPFVRIFLTVPRENLAPLDDEGSTYPLQCNVEGLWSQNIFNAVHVAFGSVMSMGAANNPSVFFREDPLGWQGTSSLVLSFIMPTRLLTDIEPMEVLNVNFAVRSTPSTARLIQKLGMKLKLFSAKVMDTKSVCIVPEQPLTSARTPASILPPPPISGEIGVVGEVLAELDDDAKLLSALTCRISIENQDVQSCFSAGATPYIAQASSCTLTMTLDKYKQEIMFPFPIIGSRRKLWLARKSSYIEVEVAISGPYKPDGLKTNRFPVVGTGKSLCAWSIHSLNMSRLPVLNINSRKNRTWLDLHVGSMMSKHERSMRKQSKEDALMFVKDTIQSIIIELGSLQGRSGKKVFMLTDSATNNCDTVLFIHEVKFDLHSHTVACDGFVVPLTVDRLKELSAHLHKLVQENCSVSIGARKGEMQIWKQLIPALVERCRTSWTHTQTCQYYASKAEPISTEEEEDPLCSCGRGKNVDAMLKVPLWRSFAPYATRIALSPIFAVSYLETVIRDTPKTLCSFCKRKGYLHLKRCSACQKVQYCSAECQKRDWKTHRPRCAGGKGAA